MLKKQEFLLPVVLVMKALLTISDNEIFDRMVQGDRQNEHLSHHSSGAVTVLRDFKSHNLFSKSQCQSYLGALFRNFLPITSANGILQVVLYVLNFRPFEFAHFSNKKAVHYILHVYNVSTP